MSMPMPPYTVALPDGYGYTEAQLLEYGRQCVEAAADLVDHKAAPYGMPPDLESYWDTTCLALGDAIRNMLKGETP